MTAIGLDEIREAAEAKYGGTEINYSGGTAKLINPLRLPKDRRAALRKIQGRIDDDADADQGELLAEAVRIIAENKHQANGLLRDIGDDLAVLAMVFERYVAAAQAGEASPSPNS